MINGMFCASTFLKHNVPFAIVRRLPNYFRKMDKVIYWKVITMDSCKIQNLKYNHV
jgi:hypothetical protein